METIARNYYANCNPFTIPSDRSNQQFNTYFKYHVEKPIVRSPCPQKLRRWPPYNVPSHQQMMLHPPPIDYKHLNELTFREAINELHRQRIWTTAAQKALTDTTTVIAVRHPVPNDRGCIAAATGNISTATGSILKRERLPCIVDTTTHLQSENNYKSGYNNIINRSTSPTNGRQCELHDPAMTLPLDGEEEKEEEKEEEEEEGLDEKEILEKQTIEDIHFSNDQKPSGSNQTQNVSYIKCNGNYESNVQEKHTSHQSSTLPLINTTLTNKPPLIYKRHIPGFSGHIPRSFPQPSMSPISDYDFKSPAICSTARESYRKFPPLEYRHFRSPYSHRGPLAQAVTLTYPYNPFNKIQKSLR